MIRQDLFGQPKLPEPKQKQFFKGAKMTTKKVYCKDCRWYQKEKSNTSLFIYILEDKCKSPKNNFICKSKDYKEKTEYPYKKHPAQLNMDNNCKFYEKIPEPTVDDKLDVLEKDLREAIRTNNKEIFEYINIIKSKKPKWFK